MLDPSKVTILNVNDDEAARYLVTRLLRREGYNVIEAGTGLDALQMARSQPDLVVLDVQLPDLNGFEICKRIKASPHTSRTLVLHTSATFVTADKRVRGLEGGADAYLAQPFEPVELLATIKALLRARLAEERALAAGNEWQATFDAIGDGVCLVDADLFVRRHNAALRALLDEPISPLDERPVLQVFEPFLEPAVQAQLRAAFETSGPSQLEAPCGSRYVVFKISPLDRHAGWVLVANDITERRRLLEELRDADRRKDEFLAMLAHELRNPLNAISTSIYVQNSIGPQDEQSTRLRAAVSRQTRHLARLVDDLLDVSRITRGKILLKRTPTDLASIVQRALETTRQLIESRRHRIDVELPKSPIVAHVDAMRIEQVLVNLVNNAAKYAPPGSRVTVRLRATPGENGAPGFATLSVSDTGVGIPTEMLDRIFDLFAQEDQSLARSAGGLGIGLTMARGLVQLHGGSVTAHSEGRGKGAEFVVRLPLPEGTVVAPDAVGPDGPSRDAPFRVLVVEDNPDTLAMMQDILELEGHHVEIASDGVAGLELALAMRPDVALVDLGLPGLDGFQLAQRLRLDPAGQSVYLVAVTGYGRPEDRARALASGFDAHVVKPVDPAELLAMIARETAPGRSAARASASSPPVTSSREGSLSASTKHSGTMPAVARPTELEPAPPNSPDGVN